MPEFVFSINLSLCSGCYSCVVACKQENGLAPGVDDKPGSQGPKWINLNNIFSLYDGEKTEWIGFVPLMCNQCQLCLPRLVEGKKPRCVETCPAGARSFQWIPDQEDVEKAGGSEATFSLMNSTGKNPSVVYRLKLSS